MRVPVDNGGPSSVMLIVFNATIRGQTQGQLRCVRTTPPQKRQFFKRELNGMEPIHLNRARWLTHLQIDDEDRIWRRDNTFKASTRIKIRCWCCWAGIKIGTWNAYWEWSHQRHMRSFVILLAVLHLLPCSPTIFLISSCLERDERRWQFGNIWW